MSRRCIMSLILGLPCLLLLGFVQASQAATCYWSGAIGDWSDPDNWIETEPTSSDYTHISNGFNGGTAIITQSGEACYRLYLDPTTYKYPVAVQMTDGSLSVSTDVYINAAAMPESAATTFTQSAGTNTISGSLYLNYYNNAGNAIYNLSGTGELFASREYFVYPSLFQQTGGTNTTTYLSIGGFNYGGVQRNAHYKLSGGNLQINGGLDNGGTLDFDGGSAVVNVAADSLVNLARPGSSLLNTQAATLNVGENSLLIVPAGFDPTTQFASYTNAGYLHTAGTTLTVSAEQNISGWGNIDDPVNCQGSIAAASGGFIQLNNGLMISDTGTVNTGTAKLYIDDTSSGISGGSLTVPGQTVGYNGNGIFTQSGGNVAISGRLYLGHNYGSTGIYNLTGGSLTAEALYIDDFVGEGTFSQSGGANTTSRLILSNHGIYNLTGGTLITGSISKYSTLAAFNFGGGTIQASGNFSTTASMTLTGIGGDANVDTAGYAVTLSSYAKLSGPGGLRKIGAGTLTLAVANTYAGNTTVDAGTLLATTTAALPGYDTSGRVSVADGGTMAVNYGGLGDWSAADVNTLINTTSFSSGSLCGFDTTNATGGAVYGNDVNGILGVAKLGANSLTLSGANTYTGKTVINAGTLVIDGESRLGGNPASFTADQLTLDGGTLQTTDTFAIDDGNRGITLKGGSGTFSPDSDTTLTVSNAIAGNGGLTKIGDSTLILSGDNTYSGYTKIGGGTLILANTNALQGSTLDHNGYGGSLSFGSLTSATFGGLKGNQDLALTNASAAAVALTVGGNNVSTTYSGVLSDGDGLTKTGTGALTLSGANMYNGGTTLSAGRLNINNAKAISAGRLTISGTSTIGNTSGATVTLGNNNLQSWNADFSFAGSSDLNLGNGAVTLGDDCKVTVSANMLAVGGAIGGNYSLTKAGTGALTLSGANTYTGGTILSAGRLNIENAKALGTGEFTISGASTIRNTFGVVITLANDNPQSWNADFTFASGSDLDLGDGAVTLGGNRQVTVNSNELTIGGIIGGGYSLTKAGTGTLALGGANTYTGNTTISAGTLKLGGAASLASGAIDVAAGATFDVSEVSGGYNLTAGQTLNGDGIVSGDITINGIHAPGYSPGIQIIEGDYNMLGELQIELAGTDPGTGYDQVLLSGSGDYNAMLDGTLTLDWTDFGDSSEETQLWIVQNDTNGILSGEFDDYANGSWLGVHDDLEWWIWYGADAASGDLSGGNDVLISAVPEPSMLVLIGIAAIALSARALRRRKPAAPSRR